MRESLESLKQQFEDREYRYGYAEAFLNSYIAAQIKIIREQRNLTQAALAELIGTKQAGISRLENVGYSSWRVETLTRLARAFDLRLRISFEEFGTLPDEVERFGRSSLERTPFADDPAFGSSKQNEESATLSDYERSILAPRSPNSLQPQIVQKVYGEQNASPIDTSRTGSGFHGARRTESAWQDIPPKPRAGVGGSLSVLDQQQYG